MVTVTTDEFANNIDYYLTQAEQGQRIVLLRDDRPSVILCSVDAKLTQAEETVLARLAAQGHVVLPTKRSYGRFEHPRVPSRGVSAAEMVMEDRR